MDNLPQFKITLRVNNQISITRQRVTQKRGKRYEKYTIPTLSQGETNDLIERYASQNGLKTSKPFYDPKRRIVPYSGNGLDIKTHPSYLDLTRQFQRGGLVWEFELKKAKRGYGVTPSVKNFSSRAGQKIRECGAAIDILCNGDPSLCRVVTLTLPSSDDAAYAALSDWSGYATNRLLQVIRRKKDDRFHWFYCVEHQKRGALHWHICLYHEDGKASESAANQLISKWTDILRDIGKRAGMDLLYSKGFGRTIKTSEMQCLNQEMRQGCGAYFSKYAAKTSCGRELRETEDINTVNARKYPPSSFWGRSQNLAKMCKEFSFKYSFDGILPDESESLRSEAFEILSQYDIVLSHSFSFKKQIELPSIGKLTICEGETEVFYVSPSDYQKLLVEMRFLYSYRLSGAIPERAKNGGVPSKTTVAGYF